MLTVSQGNASPHLEAYNNIITSPMVIHEEAPSRLTALEQASMEKQERIRGLLKEHERIGELIKLTTTVIKENQTETETLAAIRQRLKAELQLVDDRLEQLDISSCALYDCLNVSNTAEASPVQALINQKDGEMKILAENRSRLNMKLQQVDDRLEQLDISSFALYERRKGLELNQKIVADSIDAARQDCININLEILALS